MQRREDKDVTRLTLRAAARYSDAGKALDGTMYCGEGGQSNDKLRLPSAGICVAVITQKMNMVVVQLLAAD